MKNVGKIFIIPLMAIIFSFSQAMAAQPPLKRIVVIDPGHGGADRGVKLSDNRYEKDMTLEISLGLQKNLQAKGTVAVKLTRTSDRDVPMAERIAAARAIGSGAFISLHVNAGFGKKAAGYEVYFPGFNSAATDKNGTSAILRDMAVNTNLNDSVALSKAIQRNLQNVFPRKDRDLRNAPMLILEGLTMPAVVVEIGFATNMEDNTAIADEKGRQAIVGALGKSITEFFHLK